jgi:hypothetical protein
VGEIQEQVTAALNEDPIALKGGVIGRSVTTKYERFLVLLPQAFSTHGAGSEAPKEGRSSASGPSNRIGVGVWDGAVAGLPKAAISVEPSVKRLPSRIPPGVPCRTATDS